MNVIGAGFEVVFITHDVFPESRLADSAFASCALRLRDSGFRQSSREPLIAELDFDLFHSRKRSGKPFLPGSVVLGPV